METVIAGASGFLGTHLTTALRERGHTVTRLVRRPPTAGDESRWDPAGGEIDQSVIDAADVVVCLSGSPLLGNPHSKKWQRALAESRVSSTRTLADAIARSQRDGNSTTYLAGNGISYYGDHGEHPVTEESEPNSDAMLPSITRLWQAATTPAADAGARVCLLRTAPVMDRASGPMQLLRPMFRLFLGARLADGRQYFPVISLRDWVGSVVHLAESRTSEGPYNLCCPVTPTNAEFTAAFADAMGRKAFLAAPEFVLQRAAGPMAPELLESRNTEPARLVAEGYEFADTDVRDVVATGLAKP